MVDRCTLIIVFFDNQSKGFNFEELVVTAGLLDKTSSNYIKLKGLITSKFPADNQ